MTPTPIAEHSPDEHPYTHLLPLVEAEVRWGNRTSGRFQHDRREDAWTLVFDAPLHLDRLQAEFDLPPRVRTRTTPDGRTYLWDDASGAGLTGRPPQPPRSSRPGLLRRLLPS